MEEKQEQEPLLQPEKNRYTLLPIKHGRQPIYDMYCTHQNAFWKASEVSMKQDQKHWENGILYPNTSSKKHKKINDDAKFFIKHVLAFFAASDGIVMENIVFRFYKDIEWPEVRQFYAWQSAMEAIHSESYSLMIDALIKDPAEKVKLFNAIETIPCVRKKAEWAITYIDSTESFATRLVAFAAVEGIFFSGSFCALYWLSDHSRMPGLCAYNRLISRDEGLHTDFACLLYKYIVNKLPENTIHNIIKSAVEIEIEFITDSLSCELLGIDPENMIQYIKFVADRLLSQLGYNELYKSSNPFPFMNKISMDPKVNFFENRPTEYSKALGENEFSLEF